MSWTLLLSALILFIIALFLLIFRKNILAYLVLIIVLILVCINIPFYRELSKKDLNKVEGPKLIKGLIKYLVASIIPPLLIFTILTFSLPSQIKIICTEDNYPKMNIKIHNDGSEAINDFVLLIHDNWLNDINLTLPFGVIYSPEYEGIFFHETSKMLCNATNRKYPEPVNRDCSLLECPHWPVKKPAIDNYAIKIDCSYIAPKSDIEFDVNLFSIGKEGFPNEVDLTRKGFIEVSYIAKSLKSRREILGCRENTFVFIYSGGYNRRTEKPDIFIFFKNKYGFYLSDALPHIIGGFIFLIIVVIGIILAIKVYKANRKSNINQKENIHDYLKNAFIQNYKKKFKEAKIVDRQSMPGPDLIINKVKVEYKIKTTQKIYKHLVSEEFESLLYRMLGWNEHGEKLARKMSPFIKALRQGADSVIIDFSETPVGKTFLKKGILPSQMRKIRPNTVIFYCGSHENFWFTQVDISKLITKKILNQIRDAKNGRSK